MQSKIEAVPLEATRAQALEELGACSEPAALAELQRKYLGKNGVLAGWLAQLPALVEGLVKVHALGPAPVKGLTVPVEVFELLGSTTARRRVQVGVARGLTRFVGRETEITTLAQNRFSWLTRLQQRNPGGQSRVIEGQ